MSDYILIGAGISFLCGLGGYLFGYHQGLARALIVINEMIDEATHASSN